jgi:hypothetical protein
MLKAARCGNLRSSGTRVSQFAIFAAGARSDEV